MTQGERSAQPAVLDLRPRAGNPIQHVIILIQENRSFDNVFAGFPNADAPKFGYTHDGKKVNLAQITFDGPDLRHGFKAGIVDWDNGKMDGFDVGNPSAPQFAYSYLDQKVVRPYWALAHQYVLADHMFTTEFSGSFAAHLNLIAGTSKLTKTTAEVDNPSNIPWGCDAPAGTRTKTIDQARKFNPNGPFPCFTQFTTMADSLDAAGVSWKYYAPQVMDCIKNCDPGLIWSEFDAIKNVRYGADWTKNVVNPPSQILSDAANGNLASVSWVVPDWKDSDHPNNNSDTGPSWIASVVNAVGQSKYWNSSAIVVLWDDWGGWYDDVPPPQLDFRGLGLRVPCIIISPYAKAATVSHTRYESASTLKFIEELFSVPSLHHTDSRANSLSDSFNFTQKPLQFRKIRAKYPASYFLHERPSLIPPDNE